MGGRRAEGGVLSADLPAERVVDGGFERPAFAGCVAFLATEHASVATDEHAVRSARARIELRDDAGVLIEQDREREAELLHLGAHAGARGRFVDRNAEDDE